MDLDAAMQSYLVGLVLAAARVAVCVARGFLVLCTVGTSRAGDGTVGESARCSAGRSVVRAQHVVVRLRGLRRGCAGLLVRAGRAAAPFAVDRGRAGGAR